jgi:2-amino-4-hydroxy-6-hydroxymethyldihydropteridine pyrophosphokinase
MTNHHLAYLALGSNLGDKNAYLDQAVERLADLEGIFSIKESSRIVTPPMGGPAGQGDYLNSVCLAETSLSPARLLAATQAVESSLGRERGSGYVHWGPRTIDIDILLYDDIMVESPELTIPHRGLGERYFVLKPLAELAPNLVVPGTGKTVAELLERLV